VLINISITLFQRQQKGCGKARLIPVAGFSPVLGCCVGC
jgi:hypothetical protein